MFDEQFGRSSSFLSLGLNEDVFGDGQSERLLLSCSATQRFVKLWQYHDRRRFAFKLTRRDRDELNFFGRRQQSTVWKKGASPAYEHF